MRRDGFGRRLRAIGLLTGFLPLTTQAVAQYQTVPVAPPAPPRPPEKPVRVKCTGGESLGDRAAVKYEGKFEVRGGVLAGTEETTSLTAFGHPRGEEVPTKLPFEAKPQFIFTPDEAKVFVFFDKGRRRGAVFASTAYWQNNWPNPEATVSFRRGGRVLASIPAEIKMEQGVSFVLPDTLLAELAQPFEAVVTLRGVKPSVVRFDGITPAMLDKAARTSIESPKILAGAPFDAGRSGRNAAGCEREPCWLTTAAVDAVGLADDCWELRTLRAYRARALSRGGGEAALVADYRSLAPAIVAGIEARPDSRVVWLRTWATGIVPAAVAAAMRADGVALWLYARLTRRLQRLAA